MTDNRIVGPDFFSLYTSEVTELLSQDESLHKVGSGKGSTVNSFRDEEDNGISGSALVFSKGIGARLSEIETERLKSLLRQSVFTLTQEVDEMIDPVLSVCRIRSCLRCKESLSSSDASAHKADQQEDLPRKKLKVLHTSDSQSENECGPGYANNLKNGSTMKSDTEVGKEVVEMDDDLKFLLESDSTMVEELMKKHCGELSATLTHMESKLEQLLDMTMTSCRPMTLTEKQHLRKMIQSLHPKNLNRIAEIIARKNPSEDKYSCDEIRVDLDKQDDVTLWRMYFYARTIRG